MKSYLDILAAVAIAIVLGVIAWKLNAGAGWKAKAGTATQQAENNAEAVRQVDRYEHTRTIIHERASDAVQAVQTAPDAATPLPESLRAAWASGVAGVRSAGATGDVDGPADVPH